MEDKITTLHCQCGNVSLSVERRPIISAECLCKDCQTAGALLQSLPDAPKTLDQNSATRFVLYRKDRVRCIKGQESLREYRLNPESKTRRVIATCCNTPVFLDFTNGHWLSMYGGLWPQKNLPPLEIRTMTRDCPKGVVLSDDVPNPKTHTGIFYLKLLSSWAAMGFKTPKVNYVNGSIQIP